MQVAGLAAGALAGWTVLGVLGTWLSVATGDRRRAWRGVGWMVGVWGVYLGVLVGVARVQGQRVLGTGQEECFGAVCYAVTGARAVGEFKGEGGGKVVTVSVRMRNAGEEGASVSGMRCYLVDSRGRRWGQTVGLGGVALSARIPAGRTTVSEPVFQVAGDAVGFGLVLTRGWEGWGWLRVGDTDSLGHEPTVLRVP